MRNRIQIRSVRSVIVALVSVCALYTGTAYAAPVRPAAVSIAAARSMTLGSIVTVEGTVSTPPGIFESSFFDKGFGLQDSTAGIYVSIDTLTSARFGYKARVTGTLADSAGLLILVPSGVSDVRSEEDGREIRAESHTTGSIGEATEGRIVKVKGTITQAPMDDLPYGYKFYVNDGSGEIRIYINLQTNINVSRFKAGQQLSVTGFSSQYDTPEIDPRGQDDIQTAER